MAETTPCDVQTALMVLKRELHSISLHITQGQFFPAPALRPFYGCVIHELRGRLEEFPF
jgi:hypothetical protein